MPELMNHDEFRTALENAIKGKSANKAPFSIAWASGKLSARAPRALGREPLPLRRAVRRLPRLHLRAHAGPLHGREGFPARTTCTRKRSAATAIPTC